MKNVYIAETITDAGVVRNLLVQNGIDCQLVEKATSRYGAGATEVWIFNDNQEPEAAQLIREAFEEYADEQAWRCSRCRESNPTKFETCWNCRTERG